MAVIGVDGGGTKTVGVLCALSGEVLAYCAAGPSNMNGPDRNHAMEQVGAVVRRLLQYAERSAVQVQGVFAGIAGIEQGDNRDELYRYLGELDDLRRLIELRELSELRERIPARPIFIVIDNDAVTALYAGTYGQHGIVQIAGTGSVTYGIDESGARARVGGWGYLLGDEGSGYALGREALAAIFAALDGIGPPTALTDMCLRAGDWLHVREIIPFIYDHAARLRIASFAPCVLEAAERHDEVALGIVRHAGEQMGRSIVGLRRKLFPQQPVLSIPVVLAGGLFNCAHLFVPHIERVCKELGELHVHFVIPAIPPVGGAVVAALLQTGTTFQKSTVVQQGERLSEQLNEQLGEQQSEQISERLDEQMKVRLSQQLSEDSLAAKRLTTDGM
ncbi:N-acetylglucosamine kinase [Paenibacillus sp. 481]|uniref:N-acetylglucosamine kinase n=1 Tax=Paenibacillus sp. 481 TaxID=2835869 RepID=UPI001E590973|nr:BadF/BadG/BcrA/BcrD ATPase family protein [Paenibacillus sp. 481]UHA73970.1 hypothetical protein KIK04_02055 [Paenibacillus sp. 481]